MCSIIQSCKERKESLQQLRCRLLMVRNKLTGRFRNENPTTVATARTDLTLPWVPWEAFFSCAAQRSRQRGKRKPRMKSLAPRVASSRAESWALESCSVSSALFLVLISRCVVVPIISHTGSEYDSMRNELFLTNFYLMAMRTQKRLVPCLSLTGKRAKIRFLIETLSVQPTTVAKVLKYDPVPVTRPSFTQWWPY